MECMSDAPHVYEQRGDKDATCEPEPKIIVQRFITVMRIAAWRRGPLGSTGGRGTHSTPAQNSLQPR